MPIAGQPGGSDILRTVVTNVIQFIKKRRSMHSTPTCDGRILRMHYQYTFYMCLGIFSIVWYSWYHKESIVCASHFNADGNARADHINLCLSYNSFTDPVNGEYKTIMFYKWLPLSLLILAGAYYIPRKISKAFENQRAMRLLEYAAQHQSEFSENPENSVISSVVNYLESMQRLHNGLFFKFYLCNIIALLVNVLCIFTLDFFLQGRFLSYGIINIFTIYRDPIRFTDAISRTFPPFSTCEITPTMQLMAERTEEYGCHLTHMELYEKIFFFLWWWLMFLLVTTIVYIIFLTVLFACPEFRVFMLKFSKTDHVRGQQIRVTSLLSNTLEKCSIGDVYLLYRLKQHVNSRMFYEIISRLEPKLQAFGKKEEDDSKFNI